MDREEERRNDKLSEELIERAILNLGHAKARTEINFNLVQAVIKRSKSPGEAFTNIYLLGSLHSGDGWR